MSDFGLERGMRRQRTLPKQNSVSRYFSRFEEGEVMRWAFRGLLIGAIAVLLMDLRGLSATNGFLPTLSSLPGQTAAPVLPPVRDRSAPHRDDPRRNVTTDQTLLDRDMQFQLASDGELMATGRIIQGSAEAFASEVRERGEYVRTVVIDSPGGSVDDAIAMARLIREKGFATEVRDGALCASSCPLLFAGGKTREAGSKAAIGLHQFYAAAGSSTDAAAALSSAQVTTAKISRFLTDMGVDASLWLHALDTPPQALYYLTVEEQADYGLVTSAPTVAAVRS